jgi:hypothetical protein
MQAILDGDWELYRHFRRYLFIALAWAAVSAIGSQFIVEFAFPFSHSRVGEPVPITLSNELFYTFGNWALSLCVFLAVGRSCFRSMINGMQPSTSGSFRVDADCRRYAKTCMLFVLGALCPLVAGYVLITQVEAVGYRYISTFEWLGPLVALTILSFFSLALPMSAVARKPATVRTALAIGKGQRLRLCCIVLLGAAPIPVASACMAWVLRHFDEWLPIQAIPGLLVFFFYLLATPLILNLCAVTLAGAISSAYLQLTGARPDSDIARLPD